MNTSTTSDLLSTAQQAAGDILDSTVDEIPALAEATASVVLPPAVGVMRRLVGWRLAIFASIAAVVATIAWRYWRRRGDDGAADREQDVLTRIPTVDSRQPVQSGSATATE